MKKIYLLTIAMFACCLSGLQAQRVTGTEAEAVDGKIRVMFHLEAVAYQDLYLSYSGDGGRSFSPCLTVLGDLTNQLGGDKELMWDCGKDGVVAGEFVFRVTAIASANPPQQASAGKRTAGRFAPRSSKEEKPVKQAPSPPPTVRTPGARGSILVMPGITAPGKGFPWYETVINFSIASGYMPYESSYGWYVRAKFATAADDEDSYYKDKMSRVSITLGGLYQASAKFFLHAGIGYGMLSFTNIYGPWGPSQSVELEWGAILRLNSFLVGGGGNFGYLFGGSFMVEPMISIGLAF
ncbi:MAG: hypothetical protein LBJ58_06575 [Tannerellaceae bacterium]|jgi:hypothetical protein|nr:hypothetical protein [Tannerellaceae bacterium]